MSFRVGVDTGGTFIDFRLWDERTAELHSVKVLTTPATPGRGTAARADAARGAARRQSQRDHQLRPRHHCRPSYKAYSWFGFFGPAKTPPPVVARMAGAANHALEDATIRRRRDEMGLPVMRGWSPGRFGAFVGREVEEWAPLVRASGARLD